MYALKLACLTGFVALVHGDPLPGSRHRFAARQGDGYGYGFGFPFPPFPVSTGTSGDPTGTGTPNLSTGLPSGTSVGTIGASGTTAPYGNYTPSLSGTVYSTGSLLSTSIDPNATSITASGKPFPSSNATTIASISGFPTSYGTVSATPTSASNVTDPGYTYPTHGPYPFPISKRSYLPSGTVGTGISQSATGIYNFTTVTATDPSASRLYPTHGPYTRPSSLKPYSYSFISTPGTIGATVSSSDPSASASMSVNATTVPASSGTAFSTEASISAIPPISANGTSVTPPTGTYYSGTGTGYPLSITATASTGIIFSYTPTVRSQPSEYYYHHRKPHHGGQVR